jgi:tetratricopeptide (TPR) repeat protein
MLAQAAALRRAGRYAEAEGAYRTLLAAAPELADSWYNLGFVQRQLGRFHEALASYQSALDRGVGQPEEVHLNRAVIYADHLRRPEAAEIELKRALAIKPDYAPALFNLAGLFEQRGAREDAIALYERTLAAAPDMHAALARLAEFKPLSGPEDPLIAQLRQTLSNPGLASADRATLGFALGRALDRVADYAGAFHAYSAANRASRAAAHRPEPLYDRAAHERLVDELIAAFDQAAPQRENAERAPIFICGMFRSGSTLVEQVLSGHPRITAGGELDLLPLLTRELAPYPRAAAGIGSESGAHLARRYNESLRQLFPDADLVTDKRPDNYLHIGLIKTLFPDAMIVHTTRNPLDNCLSIYFLHLDHSMGYALDLEDIAHHYEQYRRLMRHWTSLYATDIHDFAYDAFVDDARGQIERLLAFLGLDWSEECLHFETRANLVNTASVWQVRQPLYRSASGRWRHYAPFIEPLAQRLKAEGD